MLPTGGGTGRGPRWQVGMTATPRHRLAGLLSKPNPSHHLPPCVPVYSRQIKDIEEKKQTNRIGRAGPRHRLSLSRASPSPATGSICQRSDHTGSRACGREPPGGRWGWGTLCPTLLGGSHCQGPSQGFGGQGALPPVTPRPSGVRPSLEAAWVTSVLGDRGVKSWPRAVRPCCGGPGKVGVLYQHPEDSIEPAIRTV